MSTNAYWRPMPIKQDGEYLGYEIKRVLIDAFKRTNSNWNHDGSLHSEWTTVDKSIISFLEGVVSAGNKDISEQAEKLIKLLKKHNKIQVSIK